MSDVLDLLAAGLSPEQVLEELPYLEADDIRACFEYASRQVDHPVLAARCSSGLTPDACVGLQVFLLWVVAQIWLVCQNEPFALDDGGQELLQERLKVLLSKNPLQGRLRI